MEDRVRFLTHRGRQILLCDFSNCTPDQILALLPDVQEMVTAQPPNSILTLADYTGAQFRRDLAEPIKEVLALDRPHVKRSAWVGAENLPKVFYDNFKSFSAREFPTFKTREQALDWLVEE